MSLKNIFVMSLQHTKNVSVTSLEGTILEVRKEMVCLHLQFESSSKK